MLSVFRRPFAVFGLGMLLIMPMRGASAVVVSDLVLGQAILHVDSDPTMSADPSTHATSFSAAGGEINARHIAITSDFYTYGTLFVGGGGVPNRLGFGLNISTDASVNFYSPFFASCGGTGFNFDTVCGTAQWALSFYEQRGPLEDEYGKPSRNSRPVASIAWGTIDDIQTSGDIVTFDMIAASVLTDGSLNAPDAEWISTNVIGTESWRVTYYTGNLNGIARLSPVPLPAALPLFLAALAALGFVRARRRNTECG